LTLTHEDRVAIARWAGLLESWLTIDLVEKLI